MRRAGLCIAPSLIALGDIAGRGGLVILFQPGTVQSP
jgi:hypothetical protein